MAADLALLDLARRHGTAWLRLYRWDPHCLSFGRHEPAGRRYDRERIEELGLDTVRRPTGGRAVWHSHELTYSVAAPLGAIPETDSGLRATYCAIHRMIGSALSRLGIPAVLAEAGPTPALSAGSCFALPVGGEILVQGRKVVGSAQLRQGEAFLQHGSLLLRDEQFIVAQVSRKEEPAGTPATAPLGQDLDFEPVAEAIRTAAAAWGEIVAAEPPAGFSEQVSRHAERFRAPGWTWER